MKNRGNNNNVDVKTGHPDGTRQKNASQICFRNPNKRMKKTTNDENKNGRINIQMWIPYDDSLATTATNYGAIWTRQPLAVCTRLCCPAHFWKCTSWESSQKTWPPWRTRHDWRPNSTPANVAWYRPASAPPPLMDSDNGGGMASFNHVV